MTYPKREVYDRKLDKFTDINGHEFWFWHAHFVAFRSRLGSDPIVLQCRLGNACNRALSLAFGPDPHGNRRLSGPAFADQFREAFGVSAGIPEILYGKEPCP